MVKEKLKCRPQKKEIENNKLLLRVVVEWGSWLLPIAVLTPDPSNSLHMLLGGGNLVMCLVVAGLIGETETDCENKDGIQHARGAAQKQPTMLYSQAQRLTSPEGFVY